MITISLCMIVKNEAETVGRCLSSVAAAVDEMIIVDTGSMDATKSIVSDFGARVFDFVWIDDFSAARNFSFQQATKEYILWLDADDMLKEEDARKLLELKKTLSPDIDSVTMNYHYAFDQYGNVTNHFRRNRLVKRSNQFQWFGVIHEYLDVRGNILNSDINVTHGRVHRHSRRNLDIFQSKMARGEEFTPRDLYYYANELKDHQMNELAIVYYEKFLATKQGWIEDEISSCDKMAECYYRLGNRQKELESALRSFQYTSPRAEFCCRLGYYFLHQNELHTAVFWYQLATDRQPPENHWGFYNPACSTWLPHLQLCVCYDRLGNHELAYKHNELARQYRPDDPAILQNKAYLESVLNK
ncbi:glycosyltransferase [Paenibacillus sp. y28]|uniref:glycosyltransferase n=1 Tax=Paenibacillus sp. y28 TaxID=3129110 RepID=UPI00301B41E2